jgi:hypothetical protein
MWPEFGQGKSYGGGWSWQRRGLKWMGELQSNLAPSNMWVLHGLRRGSGGAGFGEMIKFLWDWRVKLLVIGQT